MLSRNDYLNRKCNHREYYAQFVTEETRNRVLQRFSIELLLKSDDQYFNDITSVKHWDAIAYPSSSTVALLRLAGDGPTLSGLVCIMKEAARQLVDNSPVDYAIV